jgi:glycosyltransferase involved in cell wall biosynthesis
VKDVGLFLDVVERSPGHDAVLVDATREPSGEVRGRLERIGGRIRHVAFLEPEEMALLYQAAAASGGAIVNTSRSEGFNCSVVEALACECPAVVPRIPGLGHLTDGVTAVFYERQGGAAAVVEALARLSDAGLRDRVVRQGREQAEQLWTSRAMAAAYLELYRDAVAAVEAPSRVARVLDPLARTFWRLALRTRPYWLRLRARG